MCTLEKYGVSIKRKRFKVLAIGRNDRYAAEKAARTTSIQGCTCEGYATYKTVLTTSLPVGILGIICHTRARFGWELEVA